MFDSRRLRLSSSRVRRAASPLHWAPGGRQRRRTIWVIAGGAAESRVDRKENHMAAKQVIRNRRLTPEEAAKYRAAREEIAKELPDLMDRHHKRVAAAQETRE